MNKRKSLSLAFSTKTKLARSFSPTLQICPFALGRWWVCTLCRGESLQMRRRSFEERGACVQQLLSQTRLAAAWSQTIPEFIHLHTMGSQRNRGVSGIPSEPIVHCANFCLNMIFCDKKLLPGKKSVTFLHPETLRQSSVSPVAALWVHRIHRIEAKAAENPEWTLSGLGF